MRWATLALPLLLVACDRGQPVQRVELSPDRPGVPQVMERSPDTLSAGWRVSRNGRALRYGNPGEDALLTLACAPDDVPPTLTIIRHAPARRGQTALFPVIGNGIRSRFPVDATREDGEWRWQVTLPASDARWDVFSGSRQMLATLPGGGTLDMAGSRMPGAFVTWCRDGGRSVLPREADLPPPDQVRAPPSTRALRRQAEGAISQ